MARPFHPRPAILPGRLCPHTPRQLVPIDDTADWGASPALPSRPRTFSDASWVLSTHIVPAALPRTTPDIPPVILPAWTADKGKWKEAVQKTADEIVGVRYKQWNGELKEPGSRKPLWVCLNRYRRRNLSQEEEAKGVTLLFTHANGFPKEIWEPALLGLLEQRKASHSSYQIAEVWAWEAVNHGDSYLVNEKNLGGIYDWQDNSRDVLQFLLRYLPSRASSSELPTHLPRLSDSIAHERRSRGFSERTMVGVGHSLGGGTLARAAIAEQALFTSLVLVDPIIRPYPSKGPLLGAATMKLTIGAIQRQSRWASRREAKEKFLSSPFFAAWHPDVLDIYVECGLTEDPNGGVTLKMPGIHEALTFTEVMTTYDTWDLIDTLDPRIPLQWVLPGKDVEKSAQFLAPVPYVGADGRRSDGGVRAQTAWRRPENANNVIIREAGHLIAQEAPLQLGE
ncbi:Alpha/beta hydrolase family-domain-containing protein [Fomitopsis serialis]|uniref:Alpha/beta hydrolase family-domain-containing protein n=1 Tax=Fomitopsis serialis TaxID=139415 RepID=UPI002007DDE1|nr:Alpha/beta hydrolase family-domain-containing protein [Neoantrodia serialis]KAH9926152.1 Alpha/beta hydrolase family-domain-containing protein [Neoantrodia serialis]